jgi:hypothetical protein
MRPGVAVAATVLARCAPLDIPEPATARLLHHDDPRVRAAVHDLLSVR